MVRMSSNLAISLGMVAEPLAPGLKLYARDEHGGQWVWYREQYREPNVRTRQLERVINHCLARITAQAQRPTHDDGDDCA